MFKKIWTPDMIQDVILAANGKEPLNSHYFSTNHPSVYAAAERLFGSWGNAITACGLDYKAIRKYRVWNRMRIVSAIRKRYQNGDDHLGKIFLFVTVKPHREGNLPRSFFAQIRAMRTVQCPCRKKHSDHRGDGSWRTGHDYR